MNAVLRNLYLGGCQLIYRVAPKYKINRSLADGACVIRKTGCHVFRGYYDIDFLNHEKDKLLVHILPKECENGNEISLGYYDIQKNEIVNICKSNAWCWQQGSRLRWFDERHILFNDCAEGMYFSRVVDIQSQKNARIFSVPFYDVCLEKEYGLGLNFSRLQRIRPGYGYRTLKDDTVNQIASSSDGIYRHDFPTDRTELILSLEKLHSIVRPEFAGEDYVNHICISPAGDRFMFFYIVCDAGSSRTKVYLMCADADGSGVTLLEKNVQSSHYTWFDNTHILVTYLGSSNGMRQGYRLYDVQANNWMVYGESCLVLDGHPTFYDTDRIITDTYPQKEKLNNQFLYVYDNNNRQKVSVGRFYQDIRYAGERRCDLHPSLSGNMVSVDTNCFGLRCVALMNLRESISRG